MNIQIDRYISHPFICQKVEHTGQDHISSLPDDWILQIFSYLNLMDLASSCRINRKWKRLADQNFLWKAAIYRDIAFGNRQWTQCFGKEVVKDEDAEEEFKSLPLNIVEEYRRFQKAFPEKNAKKELMLVRLPKTLNGGLSMRNLRVLCSKRFSRDQYGQQHFRRLFFCTRSYHGPQSDMENQFNNNTIDNSYWMLITRDVLPESKNKIYSEQAAIVANLIQKGIVNYTVPTCLQVNVYLILQILYPIYQNVATTQDNLGVCATRCEFFSLNQQLVIGCIGHSSSYVTKTGTEEFCSPDTGIAAVKIL